MLNSMSVRPIKCPDISLKCHPRVSTEGKVSVKDFSFRESDRHCGRPDLWTPRSQPGSLIYHGVPLSQREKIPCPRITNVCAEISVLTERPTVTPIF